jgi:hypothetical protein
MDMDPPQFLGISSPNGKKRVRERRALSVDKNRPFYVAHFITKAAPGKDPAAHGAAQRYFFVINGHHPPVTLAFASINIDHLTHLERAGRKAPHLHRTSFSFNYIDIMKASSLTWHVLFIILTKKENFYEY